MADLAQSRWRLLFGILAAAAVLLAIASAVQGEPLPSGTAIGGLIGAGVVLSASLAAPSRRRRSRGNAGAGTALPPGRLDGGAGGGIWPHATAAPGPRPPVASGR